MLLLLQRKIKILIVLWIRLDCTQKCPLIVLKYHEMKV